MAAAIASPTKRSSMTSRTMQFSNRDMHGDEEKRSSLRMTRMSLSEVPSGFFDDLDTGGGKERLAAMPSYLKPIVKSAVCRWKKLHEDHMMGKLMQKSSEKKGENQVMREHAGRIARRIPVELLARDWLKLSMATIETRAYLVDKIMPTLILGCEKLLVEVDRRGLTLVEKCDHSLNPINFLAQYLMRNNPRYSNFSEASPYVRSLRAVSEELKKQLFDIDDNKLARIKAEAMKRREIRENAEQNQQLEMKRREEMLRRHFNEWNVGYFPDGRVEVALVQNALRMFAEIADLLPEELRLQASFSREIGPTDETGNMLSQKEFITMIIEYVDQMPAEVFNQFLLHMNRCATAFRAQNDRELRRVTLSQLFTSCDNSGIGLLDRHRILNLFEMFYDKAKDTIQESLRNPRQWPVLDIQMLDSDNEGDDYLDDEPVSKTKLVAEAEVVKKAPDDKAESPEMQKDEKKEAESDEATEGVKTEATKPDAPEIEKADVTTTFGEAENQKEKSIEVNSEKENVVNEKKVEDTEVVKEVEGEEAAAKEPEPDGAAVAPSVEDGTNSGPEAAEKEKDTAMGEEDQKGGYVTYDADANANANPALKRMTTADSERVLEAELSKLVEADAGESMTNDDADIGIADEPQKHLTQQSKVSFAEGTSFTRERTSVPLSRDSRSHSQASAYDENTLNVSQFVHLIETFLGDLPNRDALRQVVRFIKTGYMETEEERMQRLFKARQEAQEAKRKSLLNSLFEMWDNDGSGNVDLEQVEGIMNRYKEGQESESISHAKKEFKKKTRIQDNKINKREFRDFVHLVVKRMSGEDAFDYFVEFMLNSVERSYAERVRGEARKKWLQQIKTTAYTSGASLEPIYKTVFQVLYKDAETHGNSKVISANIAMLERNDVVPDRGDWMLRYVSATPDDAPYLLGKALFKDMKGISFASVESGKPIHVPRVSNHGNIHFWNQDREEVDGSFIVVPLKDLNKRVFGLLGVDTVNDPHSRALFITHEIQFFQGIARAFSIAYHHVDVRQKTMRISESAVSWIHRRSPHVHEITVYMVEPNAKGDDYVLRKMMTTDHKGTTGLKKNPPKLERLDNLFRDYLFKCVDNSESVDADAYGERHLAIPLRDDIGKAIVCIDISIGDLKVLPRNEHREVMKMLKLLQIAYNEISHESKEGERTMMLEADKLDDDSRTEILFDRLMLMELRENVSRLSPTAYAELKSYVDPPRVVHMIVKAVLSIFYPEKALDGEFNEWSQCKQYVTPHLSDQIKEYDPTSDKTNDDVPVEMIHADLEEVPHGQVFKHGSIPAQYLYNWVFVCVSLVEHSRKMRHSSRSDLLTGVSPPVRKREPSNPNNPQPLPVQQTTVSAPDSKNEVTSPEVGTEEEEDN